MNVRMVQFQRHMDERGGLIVAECGKEIPFDIKRFYYIYGVDKGIRRGSHSHKNLRQVYIAVHGSLKVALDDGSEQRTVTLDSPDEGLYIGHGVWRELYDFSSDAVLLVAASELYDESDYIREHAEFLQYIKDEKE